jgi:5-methylcytosine-specific restriction endonuclease McrA
MGPGVITAAIERLQSAARLSRAEKRAVMLLAGGSVRGPAKPAIPSLSHQAQRAAAADRAEVAAKASMRAAVWAWNLTNTSDPTAPHGRCDCGCGYTFRHAEDGELDHWKGGSSREHTRENGWRIRRECHEQKDGRRRLPFGAAPFNYRRKAYCARAGIPFVPRKERT